METIRNVLSQAGKRATNGQDSCQGITADEDELFRLYLEKANELVSRTCRNKTYQIDDFNQGVIEDLITYFVGKENSRVLQGKGILLMGDVGVGKSIMMKSFSEVMKLYGKTFRVVSCQDIVMEYESKGAISRYTENSDGFSGKPIKYCFDEIGRETIPAIHFGNRRNIMQHILAFRYNAWQNNGLITHGTTNASPAELVEIYDVHIADRIREMFNCLTITGKSRR